MEPPTGTLVVRRPPRRRDVPRLYRIEVDRTPRGLLGPGETLVWQLPPGEYRIQARIDWTGSPSFDVAIDEGSPVWLSVEPRGLGFLRGLGKTGFLRLSRVEGSRGYVPSVSDGTDLAALGADRPVEEIERAVSPRQEEMRGVYWVDKLAAGRVSAVATLVVVLVTAVSAVVLGAEVFVDLPAPVLIPAAVAFLGGLVAFRVLAYLDPRRSGSGSWSSLGKGVRTFLKALRDLLPP